MWCLKSTQPGIQFPLTILHALLVIRISYRLFLNIKCVEIKCYSSIMYQSRNDIRASSLTSQRRVTSRHSGRWSQKEAGTFWTRQRDLQQICHEKLDKPRNTTSTVGFKMYFTLWQPVAELLNMVSQFGIPTLRDLDYRGEILKPGKYQMLETLLFSCKENKYKQIQCYQWWLKSVGWTSGRCFG